MNNFMPANQTNQKKTTNFQKGTNYQPDSRRENINRHTTSKDTELVITDISARLGKTQHNRDGEPSWRTDMTLQTTLK